MPSRKSRWQAIGSLVGQAAAHGLLYGEDHRERILYENQAREKADQFGRLNDDERQFVQNMAVNKGRRQIREAAREFKVTDREAANAERNLVREVSEIIDGIFD